MYTPPGWGFCRLSLFTLQERERALNNSEIHTKRCNCTIQGIGLKISWEERMRRIGSIFFKVSFMSWLQTSPFRQSWFIGKWPKSCPKNALIPTIYFHDFQVSFMIFHGSWLAFTVLKKYRGFCGSFMFFFSI